MRQVKLPNETRIFYMCVRSSISNGLCTDGVSSFVIYGARGKQGRRWSTLLSTLSGPAAPQLFVRHGFTSPRRLRCLATTGWPQWQRKDDCTESDWPKIAGNCGHCNSWRYPPDIHWEQHEVRHSEWRERNRLCATWVQQAASRKHGSARADSYWWRSTLHHRLRALAAQFVLQDSLT